MTIAFSWTFYRINPYVIHYYPARYVVADMVRLVAWVRDFFHIDSFPQVYDVGNCVYGNEQVKAPPYLLAGGIFNFGAFIHLLFYCR
jgi:hypothetical protein